MSRLPTLRCRPLLPRLLTAMMAVLYVALAHESAAQVSAGDVVIIRVNSSGADSFTWLALRDIDASGLYWTDTSWGKTADGTTHYGWYGTESTSESSPLGGMIKAGTTGEVSATTLGLVDQLFLLSRPGPYNSAPAMSDADAGFVWGITWGDPRGWLKDGDERTLSAATSYEPASLGNLGMSTAVGTGSSWFYTGPTAGTAEQLQQFVRDPANWSSSGASSSWEAVRNESFQIVPEPQTYAAICGLAVACAAVIRKRRKAIHT